MKVFLDTSSLFKLYHQEADSALVEGIFTGQAVTEVFLSELTKVEFASTVWKKRRIGDISEMQARTLLEAFESDFTKYTFVQLDNVVVEQARGLLSRYGQLGLRALDSLQLSTAVSLRNQVGLFVSADKLLRDCLNQERLPTQ